MFYTKSTGKVGVRHIRSNISEIYVEKIYEIYCMEDPRNFPLEYIPHYFSGIFQWSTLRISEENN